ncbi:Rv1535 domain-containing protein [Mycobacterium sp.]|uniref:Rv1535 domain-containing protein n=1 Tax=Mycobacterium sp. TaxID=1785 RepID=UPI003A5BBCF8
MSTSDRPANPLVSPVVSLLSVPLLELYAFLWRVGVVEVREPDRERPRPSRASSRASKRSPAREVSGLVAR